ncbi:MAG: hypothetical protein ACXW4B_00350 [Micavibrio sp.]
MNSESVTHEPIPEEEFSFSAPQQALETAVANLPNGRVRNCGRNAFRRIRKAWLIRSVDPEMAVFSAITAEEEAASALIFALRERHYLGAEQLNPRSHPHKAGLIHMVHAVGRLVDGLGLQGLTARINTEHPRIDVHIDLEQFGAPPSRVATPDEPLNWTISIQNGTERLPLTFGEQLQQIADERSVETFVAFIRAKANRRNEVLYAAAEGIPNAEAQLPYFQSRLRDVALLVGLAIAVLQTPTPQPMAQQVLDAYLDVLAQLRRRREAEE